MVSPYDESLALDSRFPAGFPAPLENGHYLILLFRKRIFGATFTGLAEE